MAKGNKTSTVGEECASGRWLHDNLVDIKDLHVQCRASSEDHDALHLVGSYENYLDTIVDLLELGEYGAKKIRLGMAADEAEIQQISNRRMQGKSRGQMRVLIDFKLIDVPDKFGKDGHSIAKDVGQLIERLYSNCSWDAANTEIAPRDNRRVVVGLMGGVKRVYHQLCQLPSLTVNDLPRQCKAVARAAWGLMTGGNPGAIGSVVEVLKYDHRDGGGVLYALIEEEVNNEASDQLQGLVHTTISNEQLKERLADRFSQEAARIVERSLLDSPRIDSKDLDSKNLSLKVGCAVVEGSEKDSCQTMTVSKMKPGLQSVWNDLPRGGYEGMLVVVAISSHDVPECFQGFATHHNLMSRILNALGKRDRGNETHFTFEESEPLVSMNRPEAVNKSVGISVLYVAYRHLPSARLGNNCDRFSNEREEYENLQKENTKLRKCLQMKPKEMPDPGEIKDLTKLNEMNKGLRRENEQLRKWFPLTVGEEEMKHKELKKEHYRLRKRNAQLRSLFHLSTRSEDDSLGNMDSSQLRTQNVSLEKEIQKLEALLYTPDTAGVKDREEQEGPNRRDTSDFETKDNISKQSHVDINATSDAEHEKATRGLEDRIKALTVANETLHRKLVASQNNVVEEDPRSLRNTCKPKDTVSADEHNRMKQKHRNEMKVTQNEMEQLKTDNSTQRGEIMKLKALHETLLKNNRCLNDTLEHKDSAIAGNDAVQTLKDEIKQLKMMHMKEIDDLEEEHVTYTEAVRGHMTTELEAIKNEISKREMESEKLRLENEKLKKDARCLVESQIEEEEANRSETRQLKRDNKTLNDVMTQLKQTHATTLLKHQTHIKQLEEEVASAVMKYETDVKTLKDENMELKNVHKKEIEDLKEERDTKLKEYHDYMTNENETMKRALSERMQEQIDELQETQRRVVEEMENANETLRTELAEQMRESELLASESKKLTGAIRVLNYQHTSEMEANQNVIRQLNGEIKAFKDEMKQIALSKMTCHTEIKRLEDQLTAAEKLNVPDLVADAGRSQHQHVQWEYLNPTNRQWHRIDNIDEIERHYCNPDTDSCDVTIPSLALGMNLTRNSDGATGKLSFGHENPMTATCRGPHSDISIEVRRLPTESSVQDVASDTPYTTWKWYWLDENRVWRLYGSQSNRGTNSNADIDEIETAYLCSSRIFKFDSSNGQKYEIDFARMVQTNLKYKTGRDVRRRPELTASFKSNICEDHRTDRRLVSSYIPSNWDISGSSTNGVKCVKLRGSCEEYTRIEAAFSASVQGKNIKCIKRVQNCEIHDSYYRKKIWMREKDGQEAKELLLFHGSNRINTTAICEQGFDCRLSGTKVGARFGKGTYFGVTADTALHYSDQKHILACKVLVGDFCQGNSSFTRPPPKNKRDVNGRLFDSCVDDMNNPGMYIIFKSEQAYPAYVIEFD